MIRLLLNDIAFKARKPRASGDDPPTSKATWADKT